jgi:exonuclease SbcD
MRILHTADWHLGRSFHGESLLAAQAAAIDHTVETARAARVGAVVLAGDVYDRALPPVDAVRLADEALRRLSEICPVVVISGNHDSAPRLGFGSGLLARAGLHLRTDPRRLADPVVLAGGACIYGIPYLEPDLARGPLGCDGRGHGAVLDAAMGHVRADLARRPAGTRAVVVAHAFVAGAEACESERDLAVGGAASVSAATFAGADYVALGHLHGPQRIGPRGGWARYSGSPVAFSFSEARHRKSLALVDLDAGDVELAEVPVTRPLAVLRGTLDALLATSAPGCRRPSPIPPDRRTRWSACGGASRTRCCSPSSQRAATSRPGAPTPSVCAGSTTRSCWRASSGTCAAPRPGRRSWRCCATH